MTQAIREVKVDGKTYTARELTVRQVAELIDLQSKDNGQHVIDMLFGDVISARAISLATGITMDDLADLTLSPSAVVELIENVKEVNSFLCKALERKKKEEEANIKKMVELGPDVVKSLISLQISGKNSQK